MAQTENEIDPREDLREKCSAVVDLFNQIGNYGWDTEEEADAVLHRLEAACDDVVEAAHAFREASRLTSPQRVETHRKQKAILEQMAADEKKARSQAGKLAWYRRWARQGDWSRIPEDAIQRDWYLRMMAERRTRTAAQTPVTPPQDQDPLPDASNVIEAAERFLRSHRSQ